MRNKNKVACRSHDIHPLFETNQTPYVRSFISFGSSHSVRPNDVKTFFIDYEIDIVDYII